MNNTLEIIDNTQNIQSKIYTIRGLQMMLDRDLATLYDVENRSLKQAVKRNFDKFPDDFMFKLTDSEIETMVSQNVIPSKSHLGGGIPFAFTEQGVSMLSSILKSKTATNISINIFRAFVSMRKFISSNNDLFQRLDTMEKRQIGYEIKSDEKFDKLFNALEDKSLKPSHGIFYDGEIFDAYTFVSELIRGATSSIVLIDNYIDDSVLTHFSKNQTIDITIYTHTISKQLKQDLDKYNSQYKDIRIKNFKDSHDRFMIIDNETVYHISASLKDLGKKWFAFSKIDLDAGDMLGKLR